MLKNSPLWVKRIRVFTLLIILLIPLTGITWALSRVDRTTGQEVLDHWYQEHQPSQDEINRLSYWLQKDPQLLDKPTQLRKLLHH